MCATLSSQFSGHSRCLKLSRIIVAGVFASLYIVSSQAHLLLNEQQQYRARPPPIIANRLEQRSPSEVMVDLSNDLAYKILHLHSILNRNNFAFSPTALMCVLIAMYEGSAGRSSLEMRNALLMPNNRDVVRVGYRDIHRRLRTYFFDDDNPLKGLSLNKENVTITPEYETILKFYGYDLGMDMISSTAAPATTSPADETTTTPVPTTTTTTGTTYPTTMTTPKEEEKLSTLPYGLSTTLQPPPLEEETTTVRIETTGFSELPQSQPSTLEPGNDETTTTSMPEESGEVVTVPDSEDIPEGERANFKKSKASDKLISPTLPRKYLPPKFTQIRMTPPERIRRHLFGFKDVILTFVQPKAQFLHAPPPPSIALEAAPPPIHVARISPIEVIEPLGPISPIDDAIPLLPIKSAFPLDVEQGFIPSSKQGLNSEIVDHIFYLNNQDIIHTTFKVYNSVLYYRYFEHLKMSILELELDSTDYNLMIVLPDYDLDLSAAASALRLGPTLRVLRKQLKPRWVQAIIPDFKLHGTMFLTNDLQNMGICDVFEPNRADFRPMTDENGIYVKHIEQTINVNIRTRPINHLKRSYGPQTRPIQVSVNHPFMFFIIDRDMDVATMAGRVLNPLNVRIQ